LLHALTAAEAEGGVGVTGEGQWTEREDGERAVKYHDMFLMTSDAADIAATLSRIQPGRCGEGWLEREGGRERPPGSEAQVPTDAADAAAAADIPVVRAMCNVMVWPLLLEYEPWAAAARFLGQFLMSPSVMLCAPGSGSGSIGWDVCQACAPLHTFPQD
jgi:hypothetical protein